MNKLEARALIENTGNYDEDDMEYITKIINVLEENIGYHDDRRDKRFIVKFHDIFYYAPEEMYNTEEMNDLFDMFCSEQYEYVKYKMDEEDIDEKMLFSNYMCGNYKTFRIEMPEITEDNIVDLAMKFYDEYDYMGEKYVEKYIYTRNMLQAMEDNYMEDWIQFLKDNEVKEEYVKEIEEKYNKDLKKKGK